MKNLFNYKDHKPRRVWCTQNDDSIEVGASHTDKTKATFQLILFALIIAMGRYVLLNQPFIVLLGYFVILVFSGLWFAQNVFSNTIITIRNNQLTFFNGFWMFGIKKKMNTKDLKLKFDQLLTMQDKDKVVFGQDLTVQERTYLYEVLNRCLGGRHHKLAVAA